MDNAPSVRTAAPPPDPAHLVDSHLIMNVLNQLAAQDFKERGVENPLLFALSDYLREALQQLVHPEESSELQIQLLETHLKLLAAAHRSELVLDINLIPPMNGGRAEQWLLKIAACLLKSLMPQFGGQWLLKIDLRLNPQADTAQLTMDLQGEGDLQKFDFAGAQSRLELLRKSAETSMLIMGSPQWSQLRPDHARLVCNVPALPART